MNDLYETVLPTGIHYMIMGEALERFDVTVIQRDDTGEFVMRGSREEVKKARDFMYEKMKEWVSEMKKGRSVSPRL
jgi:hypothetical protein